MEKSVRMGPSGHFSRRLFRALVIGGRWLEGGALVRFPGRAVAGTLAAAQNDPRGRCEHLCQVLWCWLHCGRLWCLARTWEVWGRGTVKGERPSGHKVGEPLASGQPVDEAGTGLGAGLWVNFIHFQAFPRLRPPPAAPPPPGSFLKQLTFLLSS